jgi:two-component system chemotaxis response regulator CheY
MADAKTAGVLVVDDEQFFRQVLRDMLQKDGFRVVAEASSGEEAVEKFRQFAPELVLMDIYMPDMNGIEATREIMALAPTARILICSGTGYDDDINAAIQAGARGIIYKPFFEAEVMETINTLLTA